MSRLIVILMLTVAGCSMLQGQSPSKKKDDKSAGKEAPAETAPKAFEDAKAADEAAQIAAMLGKPLNYRESTNFTWCTSFDDGKLRPIIDSAEKAFAVFAEHCGVKSWKELWGDQRVMIVAVPTKKEYEKFNKWYAERYPVWDKEAFCRIHDKTNYYFESFARRLMACHIKPNDEHYIRNVVVHLCGHQFVNRYLFNTNSAPGWMEESLGVWLEGQVTGKLVGKCFKDVYAKVTSEAESRTGFTTDKWKVRVKQAFKQHNAKSLTALWKIEYSQMSLDDIAKGYATVAWMMSQPGKLAEFLKVSKREWPANAFNGWQESMGTAQAKAIQEVFKMSPQEADVAIEKFVQSGSF